MWGLYAMHGVHWPPTVPGVKWGGGTTFACVYFMGPNLDQFRLGK